MTHADVLTDVVSAPLSGPDGSSAPPSVPPANRRAYPRLSVREFEWLRAARLKYGPDVHVIDVSAGGFAVETKHPLKPHSKVVFELTGPTGSLLVPARIVRSQIVSLNGIALYRSGCAFQNALELSGLRPDVSTPCMPPGDPVEIEVALLTPGHAQTCDAPSRLLVPVIAPSWQKVVVRYRDGRILRGYTRDFNVARPQFHFSLDPVSGDSLVVPLTQLKALFFVRDFAGDPTHKEQRVFTVPPQGRKLEVTFDDGEVLLGSTLSYRPEAHGFIVHPADPHGNNIRVFVSSAAVRHVQFMPRSGQAPRLVVGDAAPRGRQAEMRGAVMNGGNSQTSIDMTGTRRAPRFNIADGTEVQIDGETAALVNLSLVGAQVCSVVELRPKQCVSVVFGGGEESMHLRSVVASVSVEIANGITRYRTGIEFLDVDQAAVQRLIDVKRK